MANYNKPIDLYPLLPAFYRIDDANLGYPLRGLMALVSEQAELLRQDISGLWDDFFIETCSDWVIPYIGDLVSNRALNEGVVGRRADVAKTIYYRRRKGTLPMLEELARDVTGWGAHAVAFFEMLGWTQNLNHLRFQSAPNPDALNPNAVNRVGTAHIRDLNAIDLLDGPFDVTTHTIDIRPISTLEGWYNIRKIGFFLWRLGSFLMQHSDPRQSAIAPFGFHFSPLGNPAPLFTSPDPVLNDNQLSDEFHVPGPIRPRAFHDDLDAFRRQAAALGYVNLPTSSRFFGPDRSIDIRRNNTSVSPLDVVCADLSAWQRPPGGFSGVLSGDLSAFAGLSNGAPQMDVTIAGEGTFVASIAGNPATLAAAAHALQDGIRGAHSSLGFAGTRVVIAGNRLLVIPGTGGAGITFAATAGDATTFHELALDATSSVEQGTLSGDLTDFPVLLSPAPQLDVTIGGNGPHTIVLAPLPFGLLATAAVLEAAIQAASPAATFTGARVLVVEDRLVVLPGVAGDAVVIRRSGGDPATAEQLKLSPKVGVDVRLGRFVFAIGDEPANAPQVRYAYGFSDKLGGGPYDRRQAPSRLGQAPSDRPDTVRNPQALGRLLEVSATSFNTITAALAAWNPIADPSVVVQIDDSRTYTEDLVINLGAAAELILQAKNQERPTLVGNISVTAAGGNGRFRIDGFWIEGQVTVKGSLGELRIFHSTAVPGVALGEQGAPLHPDSPSLIILPTNDKLRCEIDHSILGTIVAPEAMLELDVSDSIIDSARPEGPATPVPAWISGDLAAFPALSSASPAVLATIGDNGPQRISLLPKPIDLASTAIRLQAALQAAATEKAFAEARVLVAENRLVVLPGAPWPVFFESLPGDNTAVELKLDAAQAAEVTGLRSGSLATFPNLTNPAPSVNVVIGTRDPVAVAFAAPDLANTRTNLENAIRAADPAPEFTGAKVIEDNQTLLVFPGGDDTGLSFVHRPADLTTLLELKFESARPSIAATLGGELAGPNVVFSRVTFFGSIHVREFILATEVIFFARAFADRRQAGCVRFSYVTPHSRTPKRYRCQPDLSLEGVTGSAQIDLVSLQARPMFTSVHYGDPAYAQLSVNCPCVIRTGAENGSEMGAFSELMQPQRAANLRLRLQEYLPFGLDPGLIYVT